MQIHEITRLLDEQEAALAVLLCHVNADPDAVCAAYTFSKLMQRLRSSLKIQIATPQGPSRLSKFLLTAVPVEFTTEPDIENADVIVLLDTNTIQQLGDWSQRVEASKAALIVIDHHASHPETEQKATLSVADEKASSASEIVYNLFEEAEIKPTIEEARALFLGIAFDTRHFILARSATFKAIANLIDIGVRPEETLRLLSLPMELSERIARLKASRRIRLLRINEWLIVFSNVSAYQASAARALITLGAHVAIVAGQHNEKMQISMRASPDFFEKTGVHLGRDIAKPLGEYLQGIGGGHAVSAGVNGVGDIEASVKRCVKLLKEKLS